MSSEAPAVRRLPLTRERAATAVVRSRSMLQRSIEELLVAMEIADRQGLLEDLVVLAEAIGRAEEAELALRRTTLS
jgi:hypothetical protein